MKARLLLAASLSSLLLAACGGSSNEGRAVPVPPAPPVTGVITANFDPAGSPSVLPSAINLAFQGTTDLTLNPPVADPTNFGDPAVAISTLDGFGTVAPVTTTFSSAPRPATLTPGSGVRVFEVNLTGPGGGVTGVNRELTPQEFAVSVAPTDPSGRTIAIVPLRPLKQRTNYLVVLTNAITDGSNNPITPAQTYFFTQSATALCVNGVSQNPALNNQQACALEPLRQLTNSQEAAAAAAGVPRASIALSWTFTTQSTSPVLEAVRANLVQPAATFLVPTGQNIGQLGLPAIADIVVGRIDLPYYLRTDQQSGYFGNLPGPLGGFWRAPECGSVPSCAAVLGPSNPSRNLTFYNRLPQRQDTVTVPVLATVPNNRPMPAAGWPVVIFQHGITRNRSDAFALSATFAQLGYAVIAIDLPLHGITPSDFNPALNPNATPALAAFYAANNQAVFPGMRERTFDVDYVNNATGAAGPDGIIDGSGTHFINLGSLLSSRDNIRQGIADLFVLAASLDTMTVAGTGSRFDASNVSFVGQSLGGIVGTGFVSLEPNVDVGVLSAPGGGIAFMLNGSETFGPRIRAGLAQSGVIEGTPQFAQFLGAAQTVIDPGDPVNLAAFSAGNAFLLHEVVGGGVLADGAASLPDQVVPVSVPGAPLAGTEPLIRALGLDDIVAAGPHDGDPLRAVVRFIKGEHGSLLSPARNVPPPRSPTGFLDVTTEMQRQAASFIGSGGTAVIVTDESVIRTE